MIGKSFQKKAPVEPQWHKDLEVLRATGATWIQRDSAPAIAFRNALKRNKQFGNLISYEVSYSGQYVNGAKWLAKDRHWSRNS